LWIAKNKKNLSLERFRDKKTAAKSLEHLSLLENRKHFVNEVADIGLIIIMPRGAFFLFFALLVLFVFRHGSACEHENHDFFCV